MTMTIFKPMSEVQQDLPEVLDMIESADERVVVIRHDRPAAIMMSYEEYEGLLETLDVLSTPGAHEEIREAEARYAAGEYCSADDIRTDLERRTNRED
jgi:PHD/YefM family antitoxin component YafN of YafNO toxin-antitoxin module